MARQAIEDEFTHLKISRQEKYMLRKSKKGKCILCRRKKAPGHKFCAVHLKAKRKYYYETEGAKPAKK